MVDYRRRCNFCGADFSATDEELDFGFDLILPCESETDIAHIRLDACVSCVNKLFDEYIVPNCKINPLVEILDEDEVDWDEFE